MKLQSLASRIHPQVALNQRESQHLLSVLQSSFRKQLNITHPAPGCGNTSHESYPPMQQGSAVAGQPRLTSRSSRMSASQHLNSILSSPLFVSKSQSSEIRNDPLAVIRDPVSWFAQRVAHGTADHLAARLSLNILMSSLSRTNKDPAALKAILMKTQAGTKVLEWMWTYGLQEIETVQKDSELLIVLVKFLVAENRQEKLESWVLDASGHAGDGWRRQLLEQFLRAEVALGADLNRVVLYLWDISKRLHASGFSVANVTRTAGLFLTLQVINQGAALDPKVYTRWVEGVQEWSSNPTFYKALLSIHHPQTPDAGPALKYLEEGKGFEKGKKMVRLCLDATELLLSQEDYTAGSWVMEFAKANYAAELGFRVNARETTRHKQESNERRNSLQHDELHHLELLNELSFG